MSLPSPIRRSWNFRLNISKEPLNPALKTMYRKVTNSLFVIMFRILVTKIITCIFTCILILLIHLLRILVSLVKAKL